MKVYIVQEIEEYKIYKVSDNLVAEFEDEKKDTIVVQGNSIQEVITGFDSITKAEGFEFNSELVKYRSVQRVTSEEHEDRIKQKLRIN